MFFAIADLHVINHMYYFSLTFLVTLFKKALLAPSKSPDAETRLIELNQNLVEVMPADSRFAAHMATASCG